MKIKRYLARDMRQALRQVREEQGPDAVILSTKRVSGGVVVEAAVDFDPRAAGSAQFQDRQPDKELVRELSREREQLNASVAPVGPQTTTWAAAQLNEKADIQARGSTASEVGTELKSLRCMLETQLATLAWNDLTRRAPIQTEVLKELTSLGLSPALCMEVVAQLPEKLPLPEAQRLAIAVLARRLNVANERWLETGGVIAFVGPTGVGKTTAISKLAARWVMQHGSRDVAIVSTDSVRIGAPEQIHTLGRLLGVPAYSIEGPQELETLLAGLRDRRLVLIDTAGMSQRDPQLQRQLQMLSEASPQLQTALVLSASAQAGVLEEACEQFASARLAAQGAVEIAADKASGHAGCCVLTKLDEATSLGGTLSMLIRSQLQVSYVCDGQRIPEDISPARGHQLVARAVELARKSGAVPDEDLLQRRFGGAAHALA